MNWLHFLMINFYLVIFYIVYLFLIKGKTHFSFNRVYLLVAPLCSVLLPFFTMSRKGNQFNTQLFLPEIMALKDSKAIEFTENVNWVSIIFLLGLFLTFVVIIFQLYHLFRKNENSFYRYYKNYKVYLLHENKDSYSFLSKIYINKNHLEIEDIILEHEYAHCKGYHSLDNIYLALIKGIFWFNPIIYLWAKKAKENHEFIADNHVLKTQISAKEYGEHLLFSSMHIKSPILVNAFNSKPTIIKRIENFNHKNQYNMKQLVIVPVVIGMVFISLSLNTNKVENVKPATKVYKSLEEDSDPQFPGGEDALLDFFNKNFEYPKEAIERKSEGKVYVQFVVGINGELSDFKILRGAKDESLNNAAIEFVKKMPNWIPAIKNGEKVSAEVVFPINFTLD